MLHAPDEAPVFTPERARTPERRGAPRIDWPVTADLLKRVSVGRDGLPAGGSAHTVNVSLTGVLLSVPSACSIGEELTLRFPLDGGEEVSAVARVVRIDDRTDPAHGEWLVGCEFVNFPVKERCRLAKFLMRRRAAVIEAHARASGRA
jgi:PilZ domain